MTNGDVIRKRLSEMTDEELCFICDKFICRLIPKSICNKYAELGAPCAVCKSEWESWLQQPTELEDNSNTGMAEAVQLIENEPTAFCMTPCSEKMPDKDGKYLVLLNNNAWDILEYDTELEQFGWTDDYKDEFGYNITEWYDSTKMVVSWMPLPEKL